jgi:hypothetical protein
MHDHYTVTAEIHLRLTRCLRSLRRAEAVVRVLIGGPLAAALFWPALGLLALAQALMAQALMAQALESNAVELISD